MRKIKCEYCGKIFIPKAKANNIKFCSPFCRRKNDILRYDKKFGEGAHAKRQKKYVDNARKKRVGNKPLIKCKICGKSFIQLGSHIYLTHKITAREYREEYGLDVKKGTVPNWYRELKGNQAIENKTYKNLEAGKKFRFKKGQKDIGVYKRSEQTMKRLKNLHKYNKNYKKFDNKK